MARSLVLKPAVLLFDEPLSNLDARLRRRVREEIRELQQTLHLTVIYVTHDQEEALAVSDRVIVMERGKIAHQSSPDELYEAPARRFLADFIGDANLIEARWRATPAARRSPRAAPRSTWAPATRPPVRPRPQRLAVSTPGVRAAGHDQARGLPRQLEYIVASPWGELLIFDDETRRRRERCEAVGVAVDRESVIVLPR